MPSKKVIGRDTLVLTASFESRLSDQELREILDKIREYGKIESAVLKCMCPRQIDVTDHF